jgi:type II secretory pathway pseudopilin PulG
VLRRIRRVPGPSDGGETLVEVLAALVLFALLVGTLVSGIASVIAVGNFRQQQAAVGAAIRTISEQLNASHGGANSTACTNTVASIIVNQLNAFNTTNAAALPTGVVVFVSTKPTIPTVVGGSLSGGLVLNSRHHPGQLLRRGCRGGCYRQQCLGAAGFGRQCIGQVCAASDSRTWESACLTLGRCRCAMRRRV